MSYQKVKVWNDDDKDYVELFKEEEIRIPAKGFIIMTRHDAADFCSRWVNPIDPKTGQEKIFKKLRREAILDGSEKLPVSKTLCLACQMECSTKMALTNHIKKVHPDLIPVEDSHDTGKSRDAGAKQV